MAITRKLVRIELAFDPNGTPAVTATAVVTDDSEGTSTGASRQLGHPSVMNAAIALREAVLALAQATGKPLQFN